MSKTDAPHNGILARRRSVGLNFPILPSRSGSPLLCHARSASPVTNPRYRRTSALPPQTAATGTQTSPSRPTPINILPPTPVARKTVRPRSRSRSGREVLQSLCSSAREQLSRVRRATSRDRRDRRGGSEKRSRLVAISCEDRACSGQHKSTDTSVSGLLRREATASNSGGPLRSDASEKEQNLPNVQLLELCPDGSRIIALSRPQGTAFGFFVVQDSSPPNAFRVTRLVSSDVERRYGALFGVGSEILEVEANPSSNLTMADLLSRVSNLSNLRLRVKSTEFLL